MERVRRLRRRLPEFAKPPLRAAAEVGDACARGLERLTPYPPTPTPPRRLRASVGQPSRKAYREEGALVAKELSELLLALGHPLGSFGSICDLASGPGKVLSALRTQNLQRVAAIDVNHGSISWLRSHLKHVDARVERPMPPTSFEEASFDLVLSISLFTHLSEGAQDLWLAEVSRLLRPDGLALLTTHGVTAHDGFSQGRRPGISAHDIDVLRGGGPLGADSYVFLPEASPARRSPGVMSDWGLAFHGSSYIEKRWGRILTVEAILAGALNFGQDVVLARPL